MIFWRKACKFKAGRYTKSKHFFFFFCRSALKKKLQTGFSHFDLFSVEVLKLNFLQKKGKKNPAVHSIFWFTHQNQSLWEEIKCGQRYYYKKKVLLPEVLETDFKNLNIFFSFFKKAKKFSAWNCDIEVRFLSSFDILKVFPTVF